ncbi:NEL-type E3 ubiquitin ligase domain-containing protein [Pseudomonas cremoricolorata]|uniref:NEL-type E3 ubiquitin ligase domain-containing protein n=1 Tax=Pseudomonas cremoricolorata TaxID=157783 RepID=UPI000421338F|nr:NEL-type E3 ubiquitin ligase domain-containing protein [Pseudomonas cremoricolorata]
MTQTPTLGQPVHPSDAFIRSQLSPWLTEATPAQINSLRDRFKAYRSSHEQVRGATVELISLQAFARQHFQGLLAAYLGADESVDRLEWLVVKPSIPSIALPGWTILQPQYRREPALLRLMQNFPANTSYFLGTGVVRPGGYDLLASDTDALIADCRQQDIGSRYQQLLDRVFVNETLELLSADKRAGFLLAAQIAALKGQLSAPAHAALQRLIETDQEPCTEACLHATAKRVNMLGQRLADLLAIELRDAEGTLHSVVLYLPSDSTQAFRRFADWAALTNALLADLRRPGYRQVFSQLVGLEQRPAFLMLLGKRLSDARPDLALQAVGVDGDLFTSLVAEQVAGIRADAKLLLVPTALADAGAAKARHALWKTAGLSLVTLSGFFIPVVGALLLGQLVVQVASEVYEGVEDWSHGHQHEALDHFLGVAETVAVAAVVAAGGSAVARGFARSGLVDTLQPVLLEDGSKRLWSPDRSPYEGQPEEPVALENGLYGVGEQRWMRIGQAWYEVHRPDPDGPWRLRHPQRPEAYGPVVESNGQRGWRMQLSRPLEWHNTARMLSTLWPQVPALESAQTLQVLRIAGMDGDELRGLLVENRPAPANLLDTLRRFDARKRIDRFFAHLAEQHPQPDKQIQAWCLAQPGIAGLDAQALGDSLLRQQARFTQPLLEHLSAPTLPEDPLRTLLQRDFPGLPDLYAEQALEGVEDVQREVALTEQRVPLALARRARSLRQLARLSRAVEGLTFDSAYGDDSADLAVALLRRLPNWPLALNIEVREGSAWGRRVAIMDPQGPDAALRVLAHVNGRFELYDAQMQALDVEVDEPAGLFEALAALLAPEQTQALGLSGHEPAEQLRERLLQSLPVQATRRLQLLGWRAEAPWFNPGQRLPDGRVGYLLSGRGQSSASHRMLRERIRALYPGFTDQRVERYLQGLLAASDSPFELLMQQEANYQRMDHALLRWEAAQGAQTTQRARQQMAARLRQCWRLQGEVELDSNDQELGMRLDISGLPVLELPEMPQELEMSHVSVLVVRSTRLREVPTSFLRGFSDLRRLNLGSNELSRIPSALGYLSRLRILNLDHNQIRVDEAGEGILAALPQLSSLNLSYNPLGDFRLRFHYLSRLAWVSLRYCQLSTWPSGLDLCGFLDTADLRNNQLSEIPDTTLQMPLAYRRTLLVQGNPLPAEQLDLLFSLTEHDQAHGDATLGASHPSGPAATRELWLAQAGAEGRGAREERWDLLFGLPHSGGLLTLLGELQNTADFTGAADYLCEQVWSMLTALEADADLRSQVFVRANEPLSCEDSTAERFSDLQVLVLETQATADAAYHERGARLVSLGQRLWRLARVEQFARQDMLQRSAEGRGVDEIEVSLYYRIHLAEALDLPLQPRSMHYASVARVSPQQLQAALNFVRSGETREALAESLSQRTFWQRYLDTRHPALFSQLHEQYADEGSRLDEQQDTLDSEQYRQRWQVLSTRRESALHALRVRLTLDVLDEEAIGVIHV